jgi:hypothetical protein
MTSPYTASPVDAFLAAQGSLAMALGALVFFDRARALASRVLLLLAIVVAAVAPTIPELARAFAATPGPDLYARVLAGSSALAFVAMLFASPVAAVAAAIFGAALWKADHFFTEQDLELSALHVIAIGALVGVERLLAPPVREPTRAHVERSHWRHDLALAAVGMVAAALVSTVVLRRQIDSADEWAYTFQAALYAKLHAFGKEPPCSDAFQNFWVFRHEGRVFSQYLPGWPLFMAPFFALGVVWLAGPFGLAVLVVAIARLGRRVAAATIEAGAPGAETRARLGGTIAALVLVASDTVLINGGSRFPHLWICAMLAWSVEAICMITSPLPAARQTRWGAALGLALAWMLATRHFDGAILGFPMFVYCVYALVRGRLPARAIVATIVPFVVFGGFVLVLLRLQMGRWFQTGYALTDVVYTWNTHHVSLPRPNEWRWHFPIGTGAYCWWPMAPAIGVAGMLALGRTRERRVAFMLCAGVAMALAFYTAIELSRGWDFGYGPRYQLITIVPMAVGTAALFAPAAHAALRASHTIAILDGGAAAVAIAAAILGVVRIAPLVYPFNAEDVRLRNGVNDAIAAAKLTNAVVWVRQGVTISDWLDLTQNLPFELYDQPTLILRDTSPQVHQCVRALLPDRRYYRADGHTSVRLVPE